MKTRRVLAGCCSALLAAAVMGCSGSGEPAVSSEHKEPYVSSNGWNSLMRLQNESIAHVWTDPETIQTLRAVAWNSLSTRQKSSVIGDWKQAAVTPSDWDLVQLKRTKTEREDVAKVTFVTKMDVTIGPIGLYIDTATHEILGQDVRE
ncbi:hypothetical protein SY83_10380 [Paenibacillus swuensis]|uniref:Lipoprotein n=1 Tax=Paenibacillus swuensis TaxID=1178515 RepID=A0A172THU7_9BACL|nr:hypothetical protein [Paenibacillus swuensis]ANE46611.1 hypothetical protein SY83_10380 [Paenibacillus swuensis]